MEIKIQVEDFKGTTIFDFSNENDNDNFIEMGTGEDVWTISLDDLASVVKAFDEKRIRNKNI